MRRIRLLPMALLAGLAAAGCSGLEMKPGDQVRNAREIPPGPGVLTGRDGEFVILRIDDAEAAEADGPADGTGAAPAKPPE